VDRNKEVIAMIRLLAVAAMALALAAPSLDALAKGKAAPAGKTRTVVLDITGMH
jgi:hypothetical protein